MTIERDTKIQQLFRKLKNDGKLGKFQNFYDKIENFATIFKHLISINTQKLKAFKK